MIDCFSMKLTLYTCYILTDINFGYAKGCILLWESSSGKNIAVIITIPKKLIFI